MVKVDAEFFKKLKELAQGYKDQQKKFIEQMEIQTMPLLDNDNPFESTMKLHSLQTSLEYMQSRYNEMRIINWFVEWVEADIPISDQ